MLSFGFGIIVGLLISALVVFGIALFLVGGSDVVIHDNERDGK